MLGVNVLEKLKTVTDLPTLSVVVQKLREAVNDPESDAQRMARIMNDDPVIASRVIKLVNSALYGLPEPVDNLQHAITCLGMKEITNIAITTAILDVFRAKGKGVFDRKIFWRHCICVGIANTILYEECKGSLASNFTKDALHLAGVIHDIGKILYGRYFHKEYVDIVRISNETQTPLFMVEKDVLGVDHAEIGAWLLRKWKFPENLIAAVRWHHEPQKAEKKDKEIVGLCHAANYLCNLEHLGFGGEQPPPQVDGYVWMLTGIKIDDLPKITERLRDEARHSEVLLSCLDE